jgi:hypothetical protein
MMITVEKKEDMQPVCPHCKVELTKIFFRDLKYDWGKRYVYFCPECRACLGVSHRKGPMFGF